MAFWYNKTVIFVQAKKYQKEFENASGKLDIEREDKKNLETTKLRLEAKNRELEAQVERLESTLKNKVGL